MEEKWRLSSYYGLEVSDQLRVRNPKTGNVLKPHIGTTGYLTFTRTVDGKYLNIKLHHLVADVFLTKPDQWECIDHIDRDPLNNQPSNLRYCTLSDNQKNRTKQKNNTSGEKGITWHKRNKGWQAQWWENGKHITKCFSIKQFGDESKKLALAYRIAKEKEIGGYPERQAPVIINITNYFPAAEQSKE